MNKVHLGSLVASVIALGTVVTMVFTVDTRYVHASDFNQFQQAYLEGQVRDLKQELRDAERAQDPDWEEDVLDELEALLDDLCREFPQSRYCRGGN